MSYIAFLAQNRRWLLAGFLLTAFSAYGQTFFISLTNGYLRQTFDLSHGEIGLLYMAATLCSALSLPFVGRSVDVYPIQRVAFCVMLCLSAFCLAMAAVSAVWMIWIVFFGLRLCGQGMMTHTSLTAMARWYSAQRGRAVSIATLGFPAAEAVMPLAFVAVATSFGWRVAWVFAGVSVVVIAMPVILTLLRVDRQPQGVQANGEPEAEAVPSRTRNEVIREPLFWIVLIAAVAQPFITTAILFNQVYLANLRGWGIEVFPGAFVVLAIVSMSAMLPAGALIDRFSAYRLLPAMLLPLTAGCAVMALYHEPLSAYVGLGFLGLSNSIVSTIAGAIWAELYGTRHVGAIRSTVVAFQVFASAAGPGLVGVLIDLQVPYDLQLMCMGAYCLANALLLLVVVRLQLGLRNSENCE